MTTTADSVRDMIQQSILNVRKQGGDLMHPASASIEALWRDVDAHLKAADLCEVMGEDSQMTSHLDTVNTLWEKIYKARP